MVGSISVTGASYTPAGSVSGGKHKHTVTAKGTISGGAYSFSGTEVTSGDGGTFYLDVDKSFYSGSSVDDIILGYSSNVTSTNDGTAHHRVNRHGTNNGANQRITVANHSHSVTAKGSVSVTTNPTFSGTSVDTDEVTPSSYTFTGTAATITPSATFSGNSNTTSSVTVTGTFSGTRTTTESTGSTTSFNVMNPYVVEYCWKRTA